MADKKCPRCGLWNLDSALRCDCGYDFSTNTVKESYSAPPKPDEAVEFEGRKIDTKEYLLPIIATSLISAPFFDFMPGLCIGAVALSSGFGGGGCGGMLVSPLLALIISIFTGITGATIGSKESSPVRIGLICGFIAGTLAAIIYPPFPC